MQGDEDEFVGKRRRSKVAVYYHIVWATKNREPWMTDEIERRVCRWISTVLHNAGCTVVAIGGMPDHLHVVVRSTANTSPAGLAKLMKGSSTAMINENLPPYERHRYWQPGYGCFSLSRSHVERAVEYVRDQKDHHANGTTMAGWEDTDEEAP